MGTSPCAVVAMVVNAPTERSSEFAFAQVTHSSATVITTLLPFVRFVTLIFRKHPIPSSKKNEAMATVRAESEKAVLQRVVPGTE
jgi:hypothetical protein